MRALFIFIPIITRSMIVATQYESGAHASHVAPSHHYGTLDCAVVPPPEDAGRLAPSGRLSCTNGSLKSCSIKTIC
jgi:hypothetical protein